jgi:hypothetical protein
MEEVARLGDEDSQTTMGQLAERWGEPAARIGDAIAAVRVVCGERTYITAAKPILDQEAEEERRINRSILRLLGGRVEHGPGR